jgi:hypothetical protein
MTSSSCHTISPETKLPVRAERTERSQRREHRTASACELGLPDDEVTHRGTVPCDRHRIDV